MDLEIFGHFRWRTTFTAIFTLLRRHNDSSKMRFTCESYRRQG